MSGNPEMAYDSDAFGYPVRPPRPRRRGMLGTLLSVAGVIAFAAAVVIVYGDGQSTGGGGTPPLIQADPSPTKLRPERPGGMEVPHQDKLVYERLGARNARPAIERLLPPPEEPLPLPLATPDLPAMPELPPMPVIAPVPQLPAVRPSDDTAVAVAPAPSAAVVPASPVVTAPAKPAASVPAMPSSGAPVSLPRELFETAAAMPAPRLPAASAGGTGAWRVQLASVRSEAEADSEWKRLSSRYSEALGGLSPVISRADLGERGVYYRVQGGGMDEERARTVCALLKAQNVGCVVVRP